MSIILTYTTVNRVKTITTWICGLIAVMLILRLIRDLYDAYNDADDGLKALLKKEKKRIIASIIGICASGIVAFFQRYY